MPRSARALWHSILLLLLACAVTPLAAQTARITEEVRTLDTYPFSEPDPVPMLVRDARLYPYHAFEGYSATPEPRDWKVVKLENDWIEVFVLPEVGGKVWGAVVKETGHEFIYRNEVMKFRNIALRGPWTSGGIEFNFGVIGHTPATATPVDYLTRTNPDGSVSCIVGGMDLPSRTHWRVEIRLPADKAYFETNALWYNPTPLEQPYYNWMTAAAFARNDLEMSIPGDAYLQHSGTPMAWPNDDRGRYLPLYRNNTFEGHKSYHVVGELNDFFGGYYHDDDYGFGHWARYEDMPGQKLWLWALSREGGVWEDLLTDTDGQYVEFQAGRMFVQYSPDDEQNPITQAAFDPMSASRWTETWFPLEGTGGLTDASREGALHAALDGDALTVTVQAFSDVTDTLVVWSGGQRVSSTPVRLRALQPFRTTVQVEEDERYRVTLSGLGLDYDSDPTARRLSRPFATDPDALSAVPEVTRTVFEARELVKARRYPQAGALFEEALAVEPMNREALLGMADLTYRAARYAAGLAYVNGALQMDAYDARANFMAGVLYRALGQTADAQDAFGWAARSVAFRSAANAQLAELMIAQRRHAEAERYARRAIEFDRHSVPGWRALAVVGRAGRDAALALEAWRELTTIDPLHHFVHAERYLAEPTEAHARALLASLGGEYPDQTLLELATSYASLGLAGDANVMLALDGGPNLGPVGTAWSAFLQGDPSLLDGPVDPGMRFPFRRESVEVLEWAELESDDWSWTYLLALNLWAVGRIDEAAAYLTDLGQVPRYAPVYAARGLLLAAVEGADPTPDLRRAVALDPSTRLLHVQLIRHLQTTEQWDASLAAIAAARRAFPNDFNLDLLAVRALNQVGRPQEAVEILSRTHVLPSENARESHRLYEQAHTLVALDALEAGDAPNARTHLTAALEWPESLGQGRPYEPEERLVQLLLAQVERAEGERAAAERFASVVRATPYTRDPSAEIVRTGARVLRLPPARLDLLAVPALHALGRTGDLQALVERWNDWADDSPAARFGVDFGRAVLGGVAPADAIGMAAAEHPGLFEDLDGRSILRALGQS